MTVVPTICDTDRCRPIGAFPDSFVWLFKLHPTLVLIAVLAVGCTSSYTVRYSELEAQPDAKIVSLIRPADISSIVCANDSTIRFDSIGGQYNSEDATIRGTTLENETVRMPLDSIKYLWFQYTGKKSRRALEAEEFVRARSASFVDGTPFKELKALPAFESVRFSGQGASRDHATGGLAGISSEGDSVTYAPEEIILLNQQRRNWFKFGRTILLTGASLVLAIDLVDWFEK